jgi:hypothetical protein
MFLCRDSIVSLWPASYEGVSFLFQIADEVRVPSYKSPRIFKGFAYVTSDHADNRAIVDSLARRAAGTLTVPILGPAQIRCVTHERCAERDRLGYVCFAVKFVRDIGVAAIAPVSPLQRSVFEAADGIAAALVNSFPASLSLGTGLDYVICAAVRMVETVAASIELVRTTNLVETDISVQVEVASAAITTAAPLLIRPSGATVTDIANLLADTPQLGLTHSDPIATLAAVIVATIRLLCVGMAGNADGGGALLELALDYPAVAHAEPVSANSAAAGANCASIVDLVRVAALTAWCESLARRSYASRPDSLVARAAAEHRLGQELDHAARAVNFVVFAAIQRLRSVIDEYLSQPMIDVAPEVSHPAHICGRALAGAA